MIAVEITTAFIISSLLLSAIALAATGAFLLSSLIDRKAEALPLVSALFEHAGILAAVAGFTWRSAPGVVLAGGLLVVAHLTVSRTRSSLPAEAEAVVIAAALLGLGSLAIVRGMPIL